MFLNNRYYDPSLGVFTSVDPLVGKTGTPYLYANGRPTTDSDPSGAVGVPTCTGVDTSYGNACVNNTTAAGFTSYVRTPNGDVISAVTHWQGWDPIDITEEWVKANGNSIEKAIQAELRDCAGGDSDGECGRLAILVAGGSISDAGANWGAVCDSVPGLCGTTGSAIPKNPVLEVAEIAQVIAFPLAISARWLDAAMLAAEGTGEAVFTFGDLTAEGALGLTDMGTGAITIQQGLSGAELQLVLRHELVHQFVANGSISGPVARFALAVNSDLYRFASEALAEGVATGSVTSGLMYAASQYGTGALLEGAALVGVGIVSMLAATT